MPADSNTTIGTVVHDARKRSRLTQHKLGKTSELPGGHLSRLEHGHHDPHLRSLRRLAPALGQTLQELIARYELHLNPSASNDPGEPER